MCLPIGTATWTLFTSIRAIMENIRFMFSSTVMVVSMSPRFGSMNMQKLPLRLNRGLAALNDRVPNTSRTLS